MALAQGGPVRHLAYVHPASPVSMLTYEAARASGNKNVLAFLNELRRSGFVEGQNLFINRYSGEGHTERYARNWRVRWSQAARTRFSRKQREWFATSRR
jgi:hypothetical protein